MTGRKSYVEDLLLFLGRQGADGILDELICRLVALELEVVLKRAIGKRGYILELLLMRECTAEILVRHCKYCVERTSSLKLARLDVGHELSHAGDPGRVVRHDGKVLPQYRVGV